MILTHAPAPPRKRHGTTGVQRRVASWAGGAAVCIALLAQMTPAPVLAQGAPELQYKVQPGDTLERLALRFMEQPRRYREIARLNSLSDADVIKPGQLLRIPAPYLKMQADEATISAVKGSALMSGKPAEVGARAGAASAFVTGADGQVTLRLADGSEIRLQPNTSARITELKRNPASGARAVMIGLDKGRLETDVTPGKGDNSRFTVQTPSAALGVRGTSFRAAAQDNSASTEVLDGRVQAAVGAQAVDVSQGFGTKADVGQAPLPPVPLLPAPGLAPLAALVDTDTPELNFAAVVGAARYRSMVAEDARFERLVFEGVRTAPEVTTSALRDGAYFFRARAIDAQGLEGFNADGRFRVRTTPRPPRILEPAPGGVLLQPNLAKIDLVFRWEPVPDASGGYILQMASDNRFTRDVTEQKLTATRHLASMDSSPRRVVYWRVRSVDGAGEPGPVGLTQAFEMGMRPN